MQKEHLEVILEDISGKFDLVLEGHESLRREIHGIRDELSEKIDNNSFKIDVLNQKIDAVAADLKATDGRLTQKIDAAAADLKAHRHDTEAHGGVYRVRET